MQEPVVALETSSGSEITISQTLSTPRPRQLERALSDQLWSLAETYGKVARANSATTTKNVDKLVDDIKKANVIRNVLCHGSWRIPNVNGASVPLFVNRKMEVFEGEIDVVYLKQVQAHVVDLVCSVIDTVTHMGWQFPGGAGPGEPIIERSVR